MAMNTLRLDTDAVAEAEVTETIAHPDDDGMPDGDDSGKRTKRMTLNEYQKYEVCVYLKQAENSLRKLTNRTLVEYIHDRYGIKVNESTVSRLRHQAPQRLLRDYSNPAVRRRRKVQFPELEKRLVDYIRVTQASTMITDEVIINKGKELAQELNISRDQLMFSDGWLNKFKIRHGMKSGSAPRMYHRNFLQNGNGGDQDAAEATVPSSSLSHEVAPVEEDHDDYGHDVDMDMELGAESGHDAESYDSEQELNSNLDSRQQDHYGRRSSVDSNGADETSARRDQRRRYEEHQQKMHQLQMQQKELQRQLQQQREQHRQYRQLHQMHQQQQQQQQVQQQQQHQQLLQQTPRRITAWNIRSNNTSQTSTQATGAQGARTESQESMESTNIGAGCLVRKPTHPMSAARASLSLRMADPIASGFVPEPTVDFIEAAQCVNTLRIFMQQQGFNIEQLEDLRKIYLTLNKKRAQQRSPS